MRELSRGDMSRVLGRDCLAQVAHRADLFADRGQAGPEVLAGWARCPVTVLKRLTQSLAGVE
jgi:hypothetical protein